MLSAGNGSSVAKIMGAAAQAIPKTPSPFPPIPSQTSCYVLEFPTPPTEAFQVVSKAGPRIAFGWIPLLFAAVDTALLIKKIHTGETLYNKPVEKILLKGHPEGLTMEWRQAPPNSRSLNFWEKAGLWFQDLKESVTDWL